MEPLAAGETLVVGDINLATRALGLLYANVRIHSVFKQLPLKN